MVAYIRHPTVGVRGQGRGQITDDTKELTLMQFTGESWENRTGKVNANNGTETITNFKINYFDLMVQMYVDFCSSLQKVR